MKCDWCGREGERGFRQNDRGETVCASRRACRRREAKGTLSGSRFYLGGRKGSTS